jgi:ubiquinone/menaquinone biosynthesis C-methylase UbiE
MADGDSMGGRSQAWGRTFATLYDPSLWIGERAGMRAMRRELAARARGRTLEIGSGTGLNLDHYPADLDELILAEPVGVMRNRLQARTRSSSRPVRVVDAGAEAIPLEDASLDTVVSTLVLCTVDEPALALAEIVRVLRPGGRLLFIEHVRADSPRLARWQDRLEMPWRHFAAGCRCNRDTTALIRESGLEVELRSATWRAMPLLVRPLIVGAGYRS